MSAEQQHAEDTELNWRRVLIWVVRALRVPVGTAIALTGRLGVRYVRFLSLRGLATRALEHGDQDRAARLAGELLALAEQYRSDWFYGNAIHLAAVSGCLSLRTRS
jgi:hypothetical protein